MKLKVNMKCIQYIHSTVKEIYKSVGLEEEKIGKTQLFNSLDIAIDVLEEKKNERQTIFIPSQSLSNTFTFTFTFTYLHFYIYIASRFSEILRDSRRCSKVVWRIQDWILMRRFSEEKLCLLFISYSCRKRYHIIHLPLEAFIYLATH